MPTTFLYDFIQKSSHYENSRFKKQKRKTIRYDYV